MNNKILIGIKGNSNSGKDTIASMIDYILSVKDNNYNTWRTLWYKSNNGYRSKNCSAFGDKAKKICSLLYNIDLSYFYDIQKDNYYYNIKTKEIIYKDNIKHKYSIISRNDLCNMAMSNNFKKGFNILHNSWVSIKDLLEYTINDVINNLIYDKFWINDTINKAIKVINTNEHYIISDVRFRLEEDAILKNNGIIIEIERPECIKNNLIYNIQYDRTSSTYILNDGTLKDLFNKIKNIIYENC